MITDNSNDTVMDNDSDDYDEMMINPAIRVIGGVETHEYVE